MIALNIILIMLSCLQLFMFQRKSDGGIQLCANKYLTMGFPGVKGCDL